MKFPRTALTYGGEAYRIRPIQPDDAQRERDFISRMSPQSRYHRFLHNLREPGDQLIDKLVNVDHHRTMALVAVTGDGDAERLAAAFQHCVGRHALSHEHAAFGELLAASRRWYAEHSDAAAELLGEYASHGVPPAEAAAWVVVCRTVLNMDEFITRE